MIDTENVTHSGGGEDRSPTTALHTQSTPSEGHAGQRAGPGPDPRRRTSFDRLKVGLEKRDDSLPAAARRNCRFAHGVVQHDLVPALMLGVQQRVVRPPQDRRQLLAGLALGDPEAHR